MMFADVIGEALNIEDEAAAIIAKARTQAQQAEQKADQQIADMIKAAREEARTLLKTSTDQANSEIQADKTAHTASMQALKASFYEQHQQNLEKAVDEAIKILTQTEQQRME